MSEKLTVNPVDLKKTIKEHFFRVEGGYVNNPDDLGKATARGGLTEGLAVKYKHLWPKYDFDGNMKDVPYLLVMEIFDLEFYEPLGIDFKSQKYPQVPTLAQMSPALASAMYGWALTSGASRPIKALQLFLNVMNKKGALYNNIVADGQWGSNTALALYSFLKAFVYKDGERKTCDAVLRSQYGFYLDISEARADEKNETFTDGWIARVDETYNWLERSEMFNRYLTDDRWYPLELV